MHLFMVNVDGCVVHVCGMCQCGHICMYEDSNEEYQASLHIPLHLIVFRETFSLNQSLPFWIDCLARSFELQAPILELQACTDMLTYLHACFDFKLRSLFLVNKHFAMYTEQSVQPNKCQLQKNYLLSTNPLKRSFKVVVIVI